MKNILATLVLFCCFLQACSHNTTDDRDKQIRIALSNYIYKDTARERLQLGMTTGNFELVTTESVTAKQHLNFAMYGFTKDSVYYTEVLKDTIPGINTDYRESLESAIKKMDSLRKILATANTEKQIGYKVKYKLNMIFPDSTHLYTLFAFVDTNYFVNPYHGAGE